MRTTIPMVLNLPCQSCSGKRPRPRDARVSGLVVDGRALPHLASYHAASAAAAAAHGSFVASGASGNAVADFVDLSAAAPVDALEPSTGPRSHQEMRPPLPRRTRVCPGVASGRPHCGRRSRSGDCGHQGRPRSPVDTDQPHPRNSRACRAMASQKPDCVRPPH